MMYIKKTNNADELYHYGVPRRSGRYKWGSGERPYQGDNIVGGASAGIRNVLNRKNAVGESKTTSTKKTSTSMTDPELLNMIEYNQRKGIEKKYAQNKREAAVSPKLRTAKTLTDESSKIINETSNQINKYYQDMHRDAKNNIDLSGVSDEDLRRIVNRMNLEQQYKNLTPTVVSKGESSFKEAMSVIGSLAAITASGLGIAISIKELMAMS